MNNLLLEMWWTMSSKLEQAIERLGAVVDRLEAAPPVEASETVSQGASEAMKSEIVKIRSLVDDAMALIAKSDKGAG